MCSTTFFLKKNYRISNIDPNNCRQINARKKLTENFKPLFLEWVTLLDGQKLMLKQTIDSFIYRIPFKYSRNAAFNGLIDKTRF